MASSFLPVFDRGDNIAHQAMLKSRIGRQIVEVKLKKFFVLDCAVFCRLRHSHQCIAVARQLPFSRQLGDCKRAPEPIFRPAILRYACE
jgi:hypothetical protein